MPDKYLHPASLDEQRDAIHQELLSRASAEPDWRRWMHQVGHRGAFLITSGILYVVLGAYYAHGTSSPALLERLSLPVRVMDAVGIVDPQSAVNTWGILWLIAGITALVTAFWPPGWDFVGFISLYAFAVIWAIMHFVGAVVLGTDRAEFTGLVFIVHAITVMIVSGMVDPTPVYRILESDHDVGPDADRPQ